MLALRVVGVILCLVVLAVTDLGRNAGANDLPTGATARLGTLRLWSGQSTSALAFTPDGTLLATVDHDDAIRLWNPATGTLVHRFPLPNSRAAALAFSPDGKLLAGSNGYGHVAFVLEIATGKIRYQPDPEIGAEQPDFNGSPGPLAFSPDGKRLTWSTVDALWTLDLARGTTSRHALPERVEPFVVLTPDGKTLVTANRDNRVLLFDADARELRRRLDAHPAGIRTAAIAPDGRTLVVGCVDGSVHLTDLASGKCRLLTSEHQFAIHFVAFMPDGATVLAACGGRLALWDAVTGKLRRDFGSIRNRTVGVALSPDGKWIAQQVGERRLRLWEAATGKDVYPADGHREPIRSLEFTPEGKYLRSEAEDGLLTWELASRRLLRREEPQRAYSTAEDFRVHSPQRRWTVSGGRRRGVTLELTGESSLPPFSYKGDATAAAFSPDETILALGRHEIVCWDVVADRELAVLNGHRNEIRYLVFSRDGRTLAVGDLSDRITIWEVASSQVRRRFNSRDEGVRGLAFSPDGRLLATGGESGTILLWDITPPRIVQTAEDAWNDLAGEDAATAFAAIGTLVRQPKECLPLIEKHLRSIAAVDPKRLAGLIADLDNDDFDTRERATRELRLLQESAATALRQATQSPSAEVRRRASQLLATLDESVLSGERLRTVRAVEVLERIGDAASRRLLQELARGANGARLTREAKAALQRLPPG